MDAEQNSEEYVTEPTRGEEDLARLSSLKAALEAIVGARFAVVDAWGVTYFERLGIAELANLYKVIRRTNDTARPRLVVPAHLVQRAQEEPDIGRLFDVFDDLDVAMRAIETHN